MYLFFRCRRPAINFSSLIPRPVHILWMLPQADSPAHPQALKASSKVGEKEEANIALLQIGVIVTMYERLSEPYDILPMFVHHFCAEVGVYKSASEVKIKRVPNHVDDQTAGDLI